MTQSTPLDAVEAAGVAASLSGDLVGLEAARAAWLAERRTGIGGSDVGAICGVDPYRTALDVYNEKLGLAEPFAGNADTRRGVRLEAIAAEEYTEQTGRRLRRVNGLLRHREHPYLIAHIDRKIEGERAIAEIKCPSLGSFAKLKREGLPERYILQAQHYLLVTGYERCEWIIFCADRFELLTFPVEADYALHARLIEIEAAFWHRVATRQPPEPTPADAAEVEVARTGGEIVRRDDPEFLDAVAMLREAHTLKVQGEALYEAAKARVQEIVGALGRYEGGGVRVHWIEKAGSKRFDKDALAKARPLDREKVIRLLSYDESVPAQREVLDSLVLDLAQFERPGKPTTAFTPIFLGGGE